MADRLRVPLVVAGFLALSSPLGAQTTGRIAGQAVDSAGLAARGVIVSVTSSSLQGSRSGTTDARGEFRFAFLPPGIYVVKADLAGFRPVEIPAVRVDHSPCHGQTPGQESCSMSFVNRAGFAEETRAQPSGSNRMLIRDRLFSVSTTLTR
jgi:hypothetical protein